LLANVGASEDSMRSTVRLGVLSIGLLVLASSAAPQESAPRWITDYAEARAKARQTGKPIFLVFR